MLHLCSFYHESLHTWIKQLLISLLFQIILASILGVLALRSYLKLICENEFHSLPNKKLVAQRIMVKTTSMSDLSYFKSFGFDIRCSCSQKLFEANL